jgi:starch synthase (maltosyl-transferring)
MAALKKKKQIVSSSATLDKNTPSEPPITRIVIEHVTPEIDSGATPIKRVPKEEVLVRADIYSDGHNDISAELLFRKVGDIEWGRALMVHLGNDVWEGKFKVEALADHEYTIHAWVNAFETWQKEFRKRFEAGQDLTMHITVGQGILGKLLSGAPAYLQADPELRRAKELCTGTTTAQALLDEKLCALSRMIPDRETYRIYSQILSVQVDRDKALFSAWYEFFPRSFGPAGKHGKFRDCLPVLKEISRMGFDVVYLPPVHPVGTTHRKGRNNSTKCAPDDPGSPWAIGNPLGGHKAINPDLGTIEDFRWFVKEAKALGLEIALDVAYQCSPDHPYVHEHPEWFAKRPDGSIQYAENPPKKYEDVYPIDFTCADHVPLWGELKSIIDFWVDEGIKIFRIDNPHTKPFVFWSWMIGEVRKNHPDVIFLAEAFTRPKVMHQLAKTGFTQSYTYFTWRSTKEELIQYVNELITGEPREVFRPNFWPNTPDILAEHLQNAPRSMFIARFVLASTLSSNYGMYGPVYELCENKPMEGKEEYIYSEKYEIKSWEWDRPGNIKDTIAKVNQLRKIRPELQTTWNTRFCELENPKLIAYTKTSADGTSRLLVVVNLDPQKSQSGWVKVPLYDWKVPLDSRYEVADLLNGRSYHWKGEWNQVELDTQDRPVLIYDVRLKS